MSGAPLPRSTPGAEGVDARGIETFLDAVEEQGLELHSLMVLRRGRVVAEGWWSPYRADQVHLLYSLSKSVTATAAGLAATEGLIDLDDTVLSYFPELDAEVTDSRSRAMRVRDVAAMASGHLADTLAAAYANDPDDLVRGFLLIPPDRDPGSVFAYNQPCTYTLGRIVQRRSGQRLVDYLRPRLFEPLGIDPGGWFQHPPGTDLGWSGFHLTTEAIAKLGRLHLDDGRWEGRPLLDPAWVQQVSSVQVPTPDEPNPDWQQGYGFQVWRSRHGFRGDGAYGQLWLALPEQDMVVATTAATEDMQGLLDCVWKHLLPAVDGAVDKRRTAGADARLAARLSRLALPLVPAGPGPADPRGQPPVALRPAEPVPVRPPGPGWLAPGLTDVHLWHSGLEWRLRLVDDGGSLSVPVAAGEWVSTTSGGVPVATNGGWTEEGTFVADVVFVQTPHRVRVTCSVDEGTFTASWPTLPAHAASVLDLRSP